MDTLLYGHNTEERIVAVQQLNDQFIRLYKRDEGKVLHEDVEFFPFFFLSQEALLKDFPKKIWLKELSGGNHYRYIAAFTRWSEMWEAVHYMLRQYNKTHAPRISSYQDFKEILIRADAVRQFLLQSGMTLFKGMDFDELVRVHIDIQFTSAHWKKRNKKGLEEQILVITLAANDGKEYTFSTQKHDERTALEQSLQCIKSIDPDVIAGYDLFGTILPALHRASERSQSPLAIGRDGSDMRTPSGYGTASTGESEWFSYEVFGRHLVDLMTLAETEIDSKKNESSFTLLSLAKHFGLSIGTDKPLPPQRIAEEWNRQPETIINQSLRNIRIVRDLFNRLSPPLFHLAQMCPYNYRMLTQLSAASRIESLMLREYVRQRHSVPRANDNSCSMAIPPEIYSAGVFTDVTYAQFKGIQPSILLRQHIKPRTDELNVFLQLLNNLSAMLQNTADLVIGGTAQPPSSAGRLKAVKRMIDSFHLYLGSARGLFNDPEQAEHVLSATRELMKEVLRQIGLFNASIIQSDGEGFFLLLPDNIVGDANQMNFIERLSSTMPEGSALVLRRQYKKMFSYRKNNYALLDQNNNVLIKGNSLVSRGMERFLRIFIQRTIECLLSNDFTRLHHAYATAHTQVTQHKWTPSDFCRTDVVRFDNDTYQKEVLSGQIAATAAMEAAVRSSLFVKANSKVSYYFTGNDASIVLTRSSRLIDEWDPNQPDENTAYYLARLHETISKFREFFDPAAFERIFTLDEIFPFSDEGIRTLSRKMSSETAETRLENEEYNIWLADEE